MLYPRSYLYVSALFVAAIVAFMPSYFRVIDSADTAHHFHAAVAAAWLLMLVGQSWAINHGRIAWHRTSGKVSYLLAPLFIASGAGVIHALYNGAGPFRALFAGGLGFSDVIAIILFAGLYCTAIANRRKMQIHARCMMATVLLLVSPILARLLSFYVPGFLITSPEEFNLFPLNFHLGNGFAAVIALALLYRERRTMGLQSPYLYVALAIGLQSLGFELIGETAWWQGAMQTFATVPATAVVATAFLAGIVLVLVATRNGVAATTPKPA